MKARPCWRCSGFSEQIRRCFDVSQPQVVFRIHGRSYLIIVSRLKLIGAGGMWFDIFTFVVAGSLLGPSATMAVQTPKSEPQPETTSLVTVKCDQDIEIVFEQGGDVADVKWGLSEYVGSVSASPKNYIVIYKEERRSLVDTMTSETRFLIDRRTGEGSWETIQKSDLTGPMVLGMKIKCLV